VFFIAIILIFKNNIKEIYYTIFLKKEKRFLKKKALKKENSKKIKSINIILILNTILFLFYHLLLYLNKNNIEISNIYLIYIKCFILSINYEFFLLKPWTLITYSITHLNMLHFISNMTVLYFMSKTIKENFNNVEVLFLYIIGSIIGALLTILFFESLNYNAMLYYIGSYNINNYNMVGASAGIFTLLTAVTLKNPKSNIKIWYFNIQIKYVFVYFALNSFLCIIYSINPFGNIAHIGGILTSCLILYLYKNGYNIFKPFENLNNYLTKKNKH